MHFRSVYFISKTWRRLPKLRDNIIRYIFYMKTFMTGLPMQGIVILQTLTALDFGHQRNIFVNCNKLNPFT